MAEEKKADQPKSLEMRLAAIEDKLAKQSITEDEMRAYEKVSALMGGGAASTDVGVQAGVCQISRSRLVCIQRSIIPRQIVRFCNECNECGPCACGGAGGGWSGGGGFGSFGM